MAEARILIAEDDGLVAEGLRLMLTRMNYAVQAVVPSGPEVLEAVAADPPDLVLMDIRLEGPLDGVETAQKLRERWTIPVVYLSAHSDLDTVERAKVSAPFGYLVKPVAEVELGASVAIALHKHRAESAVREMERRAQETRRTVLQNVLTQREAIELRIRGELHEEIAQSLAALSSLSQLGQRTSTLEAAQQTLAQVADHCVRLTRRIRRIVDGLRPALLDLMGLPAALEHLAETVVKPKGIAVHVEVSQLPPRSLPEEIESALYRIAEEALGNVARHSGARQASLALSVGPDVIALEVSDDGRGFDRQALAISDDARRFPGLALMGERAECLGGRLDVDSSPAKGTTLRAELPLRQG